MGQTLTHGVYLPDEGERNCYDGLAANWQILDTSVGTIAAHTAALAGKAPAVHTHTKADITDFPVYGTTAGTICEGNDSRLSDARTPVAHTHLTSDITDLLNTSHEWSKTQTYSDGNAIFIKNNGVEIGNEPSAYNEQRFVFRDKNNQQIAAIKYQNQLSSNNVFNNSLEFSATDKFKDGVRDPTGTTTTTVLRIGLWNDGTKYIYNEGRWRSNLLPFGNNTNDVGSSSYQWNNLYAKNYYYNGVAWGLDKANTWSGSNTFTNGFTLKNTSWSGKTPPSGTKTINILLSNSDTIQSKVLSRTNANSSETWITTIRNIDANTSYESTLIHVIDNNGNRKLQPLYGDVALGASDSGSRFKTLNGINPGALSLPDMSSGTGVSLSAGSNSYSPPSSGWLSINLTGAISVVCGNFCHSGTDMLSVPVVKGRTYTVTVATSGMAYLFVSLGNV